MADCRTVLIDDTPAAEDAFAPDGGEGPHKRVARAIVSMIETENGGKVVGLEGGWGVGKSTVVNLIRHHFDSDENVAVLPFDAWAHEGDPLRRTYLERVVRDLQGRKWVDEKKWNDVVERIASRRRDTESKTTTKATNLGKAFAASALLVPFGTAHVTNALREGVAFDLGLPIAWQFVLGAFLSLAPLLVLLVHYLAAKLRGREPKFSFIAHNETESRTTTTETPNPTSLEFEEYFAGLMVEALDEQRAERRLILVIDNLDRVDSASALTIWSTLQTFLQDRRLRSEKWFERIWVIVPFDPRGLKKLWSTGDDDTGVSDSFFDKSFQIKFYIAPPVLSDWRSYLDKLLSRALPDHGEDERHMIYRVYEHCTRARTQPPTPRELIVFVNQIGAIHRQWGDTTFPVAHMAYFVLRYRENDDLMEQLIAAELPTLDDSHFFGDGSLVDSVAGLLFNVEPARGQQLLLERPIRRALFESGDADLRDIATKHPLGFWPVFESVIQGELHNAVPQQLGQAAVRIRDSGLLKENRREVRIITATLRDATAQTHNFSPMDGAMGRGVAALCELLTDERVTASVTSKAANSMREDKQTAAPEERAEAFVAIVDAVEKLGHEASLPDVFVLNIDTGGWKRVCLALLDRPKYWKRIGPELDADALVTDLQTRAGDGTFGAEDVAELVVTEKCALTVPWDKLIQTIAQRLDAGLNIPAEHAFHLLSALWEINAFGSAPARKALSRLVTKGHIAHYIHRGREQEHIECERLCMFSQMWAASEVTAAPAVGSAPNGIALLQKEFARKSEELVRDLTLYARRFGQHDLPLRVFDARPQVDPLTEAWLSHVATTDFAQSFYTTEDFLQRWQPLPLDPDVFDRVVKALNHDRSITNALMAKDFDSETAYLYISVVDVSDSDTLFIEWCRDGLRGLSKAAWSGDLSGDRMCAILASRLHKKGVALSLPTGFSDALLDQARQVATGEGADQARKSLPESFGFLPDGVRGTLRSRLLSLAESQDGQAKTPFFELYGDEIAKAAAFHSSDVVDRVFSPLVREKNVHGLVWLKNVLATDTTAVSVANKQEEFLARLNEHIEQRGPTDEAGELISGIASTLGIRK